MKLKFGIYFCDDEGEKFFGEGPYQLLRGIDELGSLRASAKRMGMAYTKAFGILKRAEDAVCVSAHPAQNRRKRRRGKHADAGGKGAADAL